MLSHRTKRDVVDTAKEILARVFATENLTVVHKNVDTAYFQPKNRILTLPVFENVSDDAYIGFIAHEVGHALFTEREPEKFIEKIAKDKKENIQRVLGVYNIVEDARIEKLMKRRFPGLRPIFYSFYKEMFSRTDLFKESIEYINSDSSRKTFLDRLNGEFKIGAFQNFVFDKEEQEFVNSLRSMETVKDVENQVSKIIDFLHEKDEEDKKEDDNQSSSQQSNSNSSQQGTSNNQDTNNEKDDDNDDSSCNGSQDSDDEKDDDNDDSYSCNGSQDSDDEKDDSSNKKTKKKVTQKNDDSGEPKKYVENSLQSALGNAQQEVIEISKNKNKDIVNLCVPSLNISNIIVPYKEAYKTIGKVDPNLCNAFINSNKAIISHMVQEFERKKSADAYKRTSIAKTGNINSSILAKYKITDDIFLKNQIVKEGKNHGLLMFVDWSGSMGDDKLRGAIKQTLLLTEFCRKTSIQFEVYSFASKNYKNAKSLMGEKINDYDINDFKLVNLLSSKMSSSEYFKYSRILYDMAMNQNKLSGVYWELTSTPLNHAIASCFEIVPKFKKDNHLTNAHVVFLTDGCSDALYRYVTDMNKNNVPVYGQLNLIPDNSVVFTSCKSGERIKSIFSSSSKNFYNGLATMQTRTLVELLQKATNCNALGFFISPGSYAPSELRYNNFFKKEVDEYEKRGYTILNCEGYKQFYIMSLNLIQNKKQTKDARFILNEFIKHIS